MKVRRNTKCGNSRSSHGIVALIDSDSSLEKIFPGSGGLFFLLIRTLIDPSTAAVSPALIEGGIKAWPASLVRGTSHSVATTERGIRQVGDGMPPDQMSILVKNFSR